VASVGEHEPSRHERLRLGLEGGVAAGAVAGALFALGRLLVLTEIAVVVAWFAPSVHSPAARFARRAVWVALKLPAFPFVGDRALVPGFDLAVVALGLVAHFSASIAWGALFGVAAAERSRAVTIALGLLWGLVAGLVEGHALARVVGGGFVANPAVAFAYLVYGLALAWSLLRFERRRGWPRRRDAPAPS
jgi:hypothetical protein